MIATRLIWTALLLCLSTSVAYGYNNRGEGQTIVKTFHMGPTEELASNDNPQQAQTVEEAKFFDPPPCRYCIQCHYRHWCPYCGYCPLYDDSDNAEDWENRTTWPSKHEDSWMRELIY